MKEYALYNDKDEILTVGTVEDIASYLGRNVRCVQSSISKLKHGIIKGFSKGYMIYEVME